jgi:hypothetical protein
MESMMRVMQDIQRLRESGGAGLSDEARRKNAEELIVKLSQYMNIGVDDEGGDYGDEDGFGEFKHPGDK